MRWSVGIQADAGRTVSREDVVELADTVAGSGGIASGIGSQRYGITLVVQASSRDEAVEKATQEFTRAVAAAGLPAGPVVRVEAAGEHEAVDGYQGGDG